MSAARPHFLLYSENRPRTDAAAQAGWRFVLQAADGRTQLEVEDAEPEGSAERLALLAVVRGLEALEQPSQVTLVSSSRYVARGLRFGLREFRQRVCLNQLEEGSSAGNADLWHRVDRAMNYHEVHLEAIGAAAGAADVEPVPHARPEATAQHRTRPRWHSPRRRNLVARLFQSLLLFLGRLFSSPSHATC